MGSQGLLAPSLYVWMGQRQDLKLLTTSVCDCTGDLPTRPARCIKSQYPTRLRMIHFLEQLETYHI
jgi:hypothetical protein